MHFPTLETLKARGTKKWTTYDEDILPLWVAESDFPTLPAVIDTMQQAVDNETFGYAPGRSDLPTALADFYEARYNWRPEPNNIHTIGDVVRAMLLAIQYFTREDSAIVVPSPAYPPFLELPETAGRERIDISAVGGLDLAEVEGAFKAGAGALLLCSPHNPLGYTFDEETLRSLIKIAAKYDARLIVDEIHAPLVLDGTYIPAASLGDVAEDVCLTITAPSKAWNVAGLKCAQFIFTNPKDLEIWDSLTGVAKDGTGTLGVLAAATCYKHGWDHLEEELEYLRATRDWVADELEKNIPGLKATRPQATYLMWLDFSETAIGHLEQPAKWLRAHAKVALNEGTTFGDEGAHHARLNFATSRDILTEAISRMAKAIAQV